MLALQQRLAALGYWLGEPDGTFGLLTQQAVLALQKVAGLDRDSTVGPRTEVALKDGVAPQARSTAGRVIEIDKEHQIVLVVTDGHVDAVLNTSTGSGKTYVSEGRTKVASTPSGEFRITWQVDGEHQSPLGWLYRPKYFNGGIALHGYDSVPPYPASHGCVRVSDPAMDWIWAQNIAPIGTPVWVY